MLDHKPDAIRHAHKSRVVGVNAVHGEIIGVGGHAEAECQVTLVVSDFLWSYGL